MKKILLLLFVTFLFSCDTDQEYEDLNKDPNSPTNVSTDALFTSSLHSLFNQMESTNVNTNIFRLLAQYWTETTYTDESNYDLITRNIPANHWSELYRDVLFDLQDSKMNVDSNVKKGQIEVLEVYTWQQLVDTFGDIPYSEALKSGENVIPAYDDAATIYNDLISRIDVAISNLKSGDLPFVTADLMYHGNTTAWLKLAHSLKLKLAMRIADVNSTLAASTSQAAVSGGLFTSNSDNAIFNYLASTPNTNPLWVDLVQSNRSDFVAANTIVDYMNGLSDPRRPFYFQQNLGADVYQGGIYGASNNPLLNSLAGESMYDPTFRGVLLDYAEVEFLLAEAVERGYSVGGTAVEHYNKGITASMEDWGVASADIATYLARTDVSYTTASGTWRQKIGKQFWLAMYNRGFEGWCVYRKYDAPVFNIAFKSQLPVPKRYTYPLFEQTLNKTNYTAASVAIGGDLMETPVFWDVD